MIALALLLCAWPALAQQQVFRPITSYRISISTTAVTAPQTFSAQSRIARVMCSVSCTLAFPVTPAVLSVTIPVALTANEKEYFRVTPGSTIAVVAVGNGTLYVTEME